MRNIALINEVKLVFIQPYIIFNLPTVYIIKKPAVIIEPFFLDNQGDVDIYKRIGPKELARAITEGILNKNIKQRDDYMISDTVKVFANENSPIVKQMQEQIKILQGVVGLK